MFDLSWLAAGGAIVALASFVWLIKRLLRRLLGMPQRRSTARGETDWDEIVLNRPDEGR